MKTHSVNWLFKAYPPAAQSFVFFSFLKQLNQINNQWNSEGRGVRRGLSGMKPLFVTDRLPRPQTCQGKLGCASTFENLSWRGCTRLTNRWSLSCSANEMRMGRFSVKEKKLILFVRDFPELLFYSYLLACRGQEDEAERRSSKMPRHTGQ